MIFWNLYQIYKDTNNLKTFISDLTNYYPSYTNYIYDTNGLELYMQILVSDYILNKMIYEMEYIFIQIMKIMEMKNIL